MSLPSPYQPSGDQKLEKLTEALQITRSILKEANQQVGYALDLANAKNHIECLAATNDLIDALKLSLDALQQ